MIFWGKNWNQQEPGQALKAKLLHFYETLNTTDSGYLGTLRQYFDENPAESSNFEYVGPEATVDSVVDEHEAGGAPTNVGEKSIENEIAEGIKEEEEQHHKTWARGINAQFVVLPAPGTGYETGFAAGFCGYHAEATEGGVTSTFTFYPYMGEAPFHDGCIGFDEQGIAAHVDEMVASHEFAESATDPEIGKGWMGNAGSEDEIGDICATHTYEAFKGSEIWVQPEWDNNQITCSLSDAEHPHLMAFAEPATIEKNETTHEMAATLNGAIYPEGRRTTYYFELGEGNGPEVRLPGSEGTVEGNGLTAVHVHVTGLTLGQIYHYHLVAEHQEPNEVAGAASEALFLEPPVPTVTNVQANAGAPSGGTVVAITGSGFLSSSTTTVKFGATAVPYSGVTVESNTEIRAVAPPGNATVNVRVTTVGGTSAMSPADRFSYRQRVATEWGKNASGQLGNNTTTASPSPVEVCALGQTASPCTAHLNNATSIGLGENFSAALLANGSVVTWGTNSNGQLGNGTTTQSKVPVEVCAVGQTAPCSTHLSHVVAVGTGFSHAVALTEEGKVLTWGSNSLDQLGDGRTHSQQAKSTVPVEVCAPGQSAPCSEHPLTGVVAIAAGPYDNLALLNNGTVVAWGYGGSGQLGNDQGANSTVPVHVCETEETPCLHFLGNVTSVAAGDQTSYALMSNGTVKAWGEGLTGELGQGREEESRAPVPVCAAEHAHACPGGPYLSGVTAIAAGFHHALALLNTGGVVAWGENLAGQLGNGSSFGPEGCNASSRSCSTTPLTVSGLSEATAIAAGDSQSMALLRNGNVETWGGDAGEQLGYTEGLETCREPVLCSTLPHRVSNLSEATAIAAGYEDSAALGAVNPTVTNVQSNAGPPGGGKTVMISGYGFSTSGETTVQFGATTLPSSSVTVESGTEIKVVTPAGSGTVDVTVTDSQGTSTTSTADQFTYRQPVAGDWGKNGFGQLGNNSLTASPTAVAVCAVGETASPCNAHLTEAISIAEGAGFSVGLLANGSVVTWGTNTSGQLGNGTTTASKVPVKVCAQGQSAPCSEDPLTGVVAVAAGTSGAIALTEGGEVVAWGSNNFSQLGDGLRGSQQAKSTVPVKVCAPGQSAPCSEHLTGVVAIAAGNYHDLALLSNGTAVAWGFGGAGQLGNDQGANSAVPVHVCETEEEAPCSHYLSNVVAVAGGQQHSLALMANGTVAAWGENDVGQLGTWTLMSSNHPVETVNLSEVTAIAANKNQSYALLASGKVEAWGENKNGVLGLGSPFGPEGCQAGTTSCSILPRLVSGMTEATAIAAGQFDALALLRSGNVDSWGGDESEQLGYTSGLTECGSEPKVKCAPAPHQVESVSQAIAITGGSEESGAVGL